MAATAASVTPVGSIVADLDIHKVRNLIEESTLQNLRSIQHKDAYGNDIGMCLHRPVAQV